MEVLEQMNEQEMKRVAIEKYVNIQLQMLGISTEDLEISKQ